jgi:hypothetical protein
MRRELIFLVMALILTHSTMNAIEGWEAAVILTNGNSVTTTDYPVGSQPLLSGPTDWAVSMSTPETRSAWGDVKRFFR